MSFNLSASDIPGQKTDFIYAGTVSPITENLQFFDSRTKPEFDTDDFKLKSGSYTDKRLNGYDSENDAPGDLILRLCDVTSGKNHTKLDFSPKRLLKSAFYSITGFCEDDPCKILVDYDGSKFQVKFSLGWK